MPNPCKPTQFFHEKLIRRLEIAVKEVLDEEGLDDSEFQTPLEVPLPCMEISAAQARAPCLSRAAPNPQPRDQNSRGCANLHEPHTPTLCSDDHIVDPALPVQPGELGIKTRVPHGDHCVHDLRGSSAMEESLSAQLTKSPASQLSQACGRSNSWVLTSSAKNFKQQHEDPFGVQLKHKSHTGVVTGNIREHEAIDLHHKFLEMDPDMAGIVLPELMLSGDSQTDEVRTNLSEAVMSINQVLGSNHEGPEQMMSLETFKVVMLADRNDLVSQIGETQSNMIFAIREQFVKHKVADKIADTVGVNISELRDSSTGSRSVYIVETYLEPVVAVVILVNALIIGISLDHSSSWRGWDCFEFFFATFFLAELVVKLCTFGILDYFLGDDWMWNCFDFIVVAFALLDTGMTLYSWIVKNDSMGKFANLAVVRLIRLIRITRLVRLLNMVVCKELTLMVIGIFEGLRTLLWAIVFLLVFIYAFGVIVRQVFDPASLGYDCADAVARGLQNPDGSFAAGANCNRGARAFDLYGKYMFRTVPRSMVTLFLCLTDSCNAPDGTSLIWSLWEVYGAWFVVAYFLIFFFITFGIFNLILAIFVENTMLSAQLSRQRRAARRHQENIRHAQNLETLLVAICTTQTEDDVVGHVPSGSKRGLRRTLEKMRMTKATSKKLSSRHLSMRVNHATFDRALEQDEVKALLEDLDVSPSSRDQLFDILDADGNGYLAINELVDGIMKLRGPADKGDIVSCALMTRCIQNHIRRFEEAVLHNQKHMKKLILSLRAEQSASLSIDAASGRSSAAA